MTRGGHTRDRTAEAGPRRYYNAQDKAWHVQLTQGDTHVTGDPTEVLTTVLGSCISACIRDPHAGVGGMNHFLLPEGSDSDRHAVRYGVNAMELLINGLLKRGATRSGLEAKLFGGANVLAGLSDVGSRNADFAHRFLADEGIPVIGGNVGGNLPRRIQYWPTTGRARQLALVPSESAGLAERELNKARQIERHQKTEGDDVELF